MWQVDSDCISSLFTFQHMQHMCMDLNITVSHPDNDLDNNQLQNKAVIVDAGRIYKLPFTFSLVNLLPKCRHYSSKKFSLFTMPDDIDTSKIVLYINNSNINFLCFKLIFCGCIFF